MSHHNNNGVKAIIKEMQKTIDDLVTEVQRLQYDLDRYSTRIDLLILERDAALLREHHAKFYTASTKAELERTQEKLTKFHEYIAKLEARIERP